MKNKILRIATRKSPLALAQTNLVKAQLLKIKPDLKIELIAMTTQGDQMLDSPLAKIGGKGLFTKELEKALLNHEADLAVHSLKDMPVTLPVGLTLSAFLKRAEPHDAFVSEKYATLSDLPEGAIIGTSSLRRQCQLQALNKKFKLVNLRGNVNTRLKRLVAGDFDAIILAVAGLQRLNLTQYIKEKIALTTLLPAVGQAVLAIESRQDDDLTKQLVSALNDHITERCITAERKVNAILNGGCQVPLAVYCEFETQFKLRALVGKPDGSILLRANAIGNDPTQMAEQCAKDLLAQGAAAILQEIYSNND